MGASQVSSWLGINRQHFRGKQTIHARLVWLGFTTIHKGNLVILLLPRSLWLLATESSEELKLLLPDRGSTEELAAP
jgi:hypothetical protein